MKSKHCLRHLYTMKQGMQVLDKKEENTHIPRAVLSLSTTTNLN